MPEMVRNIVGSIVRWALTGAAAWIVAQGVITEEQAGWIIAAIITGVATLGWSLWQKYRSKLKFFTALELPANATTEKVDDVIANTDKTENVAKAFQ